MSEMKQNEPPVIGTNIQHVRKQRNLTLDSLAERSGVSKGMLSQIESSKVNPTIATIWKISRGLDVDLDALLRGKDDRGRRFQVTRKDDAIVLDTEANGTHLEVLSPLEMAEHLEIYMLTFDPAGALHSRAHASRSEEYLTILDGAVRVSVANNQADLYPGDFIIYNCDIDHSIVNISEGASRVHMIVRFPTSEWS